MAGILTITFGDLRFRAARFAVAVLAAAVVFALAVLLSGLSSTFDREIATTVADAGADAWVVAAGSPGPLIVIQQAAVPATGPART